MATTESGGRNGRSTADSIVAMLVRLAPRLETMWLWAQEMGMGLG